MIPVLFAMLLLGCARPAIRSVVLPPTVVGEELADGVDRVTPLYDDVGLLGVQVSGIARGSLAQHLGLESGDVILALAGLPCDHVVRCRAGTRRVQAAISRRRPFSIVVKRAGEPLVFEYTYPRLRHLPM